MQILCKYQSAGGSREYYVSSQLELQKHYKRDSTLQLDSLRGLEPVVSGLELVRPSIVQLIARPESLSTVQVDQIDLIPPRSTPEDTDDSESSDVDLESYSHAELRKFLVPQQNDDPLDPVSQHDIPPGEMAMELDSPNLDVEDEAVHLGLLPFNDNDKEYELAEELALSHQEDIIDEEVDGSRYQTTVEDIEEEEEYIRNYMYGTINRGLVDMEP